ncbi:hypothetical protein SUGI_0043440 [Cryptomeria japonica]|uniref:protein HEADING DATE REPRESSOR 1 n=1 Tax=Cryptomeria japonica TaxID=3369 RepID=UPI002408D04B|nr:protein HEADING DATE REPRESSOR 1 [Cryptomeria japonica]GLJ06627.1 hypothetical protein SUGI_0043440 [Cryptomeria japonica]
MGADTVVQCNNRQRLIRKREIEGDSFAVEGIHMSGGRKEKRGAEELLPCPDFEEMVYPRGWSEGKKRKLVNVDVVESMRRIAIQEMNRKDREIDGLNEQLEEDCKTMELLQLQLQQERAKRLEAERQNAWLNEQVSTIMDMIHDTPKEDENPTRKVLS